MLYTIYQFLSLLLRYDSYYHVAKRAITVSNLLGYYGAACIEYGKQRVEVIWAPQVKPNYIEEIIKLDNILSS